MGTSGIAFVVGLVAFFSTGAIAQTMKPAEIYQRCYMRLVRDLPADNDARLVAVRAGTLKPAQACLDLLQLADFNTNGVLKNRNSEVAKSILRTVNDFHRTWFTARSMSFNFGASSLIRDQEEPALYLTRAVFHPGLKYDSVVKTNSGLRGVRDLVVADKTLPPFEQQTFVNYPEEDEDYHVADRTMFYLSHRPASVDGAGKLTIATEKTVVVPNIMDIGNLVGVVASRDLNIGPLFLPQTAGNFTKDEINLIYAGGKKTNLNEHAGGGVLGSQGFFLNNTGLNLEVLPRDYDYINRRLTSRIYEDLLCHQMPSLEAGDVSDELAQFKNSEHPFQKSKSCLQCHAGIDPLAMPYANMISYRSQRGNETSGLAVVSMGILPTSNTAKTFALQKHPGYLKYRRLLGGGVKKTTVNSIAAIGNAISDERDFYLCATKRYYKFLTGVDVQLTAVAEKEDKLGVYHQKIVSDLATAFQKDGRVEVLMYNIFNSETFRTRNAKTLLEEK